MKIAYFDYWTLGIQNFVHIDAELKKRGHETILLHVGSFRSPNLKEEVVGGIKCRDISYYGTNMISTMLEREKPDVLLTLNTFLMLDRVVAMSCRVLKIKSAFLMHGIRDLGSSNGQLIAIMDKSSNSLVNKIMKSRKYIMVVIPNYLHVLAKYKPVNILNMRFVKVLYSYFKNPGMASYYPECTDEIISDKCLVYSASDAIFYEKLGYAPEHITVVGNPKYDSLLDLVKRHKITTDMLPCRVLAMVQAGTKYALYLDEALPEAGNYGGFTSVLRDKFISDCAKRLERENVKLVVKLHPATKEKNIQARHGNCLIEAENLDALINYSEFCICIMSTVINHCVLMDKPVLLPRWSGALKNLPAFFANVGVSNCWDNIDDKLNLAIDRDAREEYKKKYITVVTPDAARNVVRAIDA